MGRQGGRVNKATKVAPGRRVRRYVDADYKSLADFCSLATRATVRVTDLCPCSYPIARGLL